MDEPTPELTTEPVARVGVGSILADRYVLGPILGRGGAADVYRATDLVLSRQVAVKVLRDAADNETDRARFVVEARTVANLGHHGLVTVLDAGISDTGNERLFLVMELVEGQTLSARIAAGPMAEVDIASTALHLAESIAYAHARNVIHRDVKPGNVLLSETGAVKLADFGIARLIGDTVRHTRTGTAVGTAAYLAPEQVLGEPLTTAVDLYSLGLVVLQMFTAELAFPGPATEAALARLSRQPEVPRHLPTLWQSLISEMTSREPSARPDAAEVAARIRRLAGAPTSAPEPTTAVLTDVVPTHAPPAPPRAETPPPPPPPPPSSSSVPRQPLSPPAPTPGLPPAATPASVLSTVAEWARGVQREYVVFGAVAIIFVLLLLVAAATAG